MGAAKDGVVLELKDVEKKRVGFLPVSFCLHGGEGLLVLGPNGGGKTTLLDIISGVTRPDSGRVKAPLKIGYAMTNDGFFDGLSCMDNLMAEAALCGLFRADAKKEVLRVSKMCGITPFLRKKVGILSTGMRAKTELAAALITRPEILLLDETFGGLDAVSYALIKDVVLQEKARGAAVIIVAHGEDKFYGICDKILKLPESVITQNVGGL